MKKKTIEFFLLITIIVFIFKNSSKTITINNIINKFEDLNWILGFVINNFVLNILVILIIFIFLIKNENINTNYNLWLILTIIIAMYLSYFIKISITFNNSISLKKININLLNGLLNIHPFLIIFLYSFIIICFLINLNITKKIISVKKAFYLKTKLFIYTLIILWSIFLGSWWAIQELNWGGWWNWDFVEFMAFLFLYLMVVSVHIKTNVVIFDLLFVKSIKLLILIILIVRFDLINSIHNFVLSNFLSINYYYLILVTLLYLIQLKLNSNKIFLKQNKSKILLFALFLLVIFYNYLIFTILINVLNINFNISLFFYMKKILIFFCSFMFYLLLIKLKTYYIVCLFLGSINLFLINFILMLNLKSRLNYFYGVHFCWFLITNLLFIVNFYTTNYTNPLNKDYVSNTYMFLNLNFFSIVSEFKFNIFIEMLNLNCYKVFNSKFDIDIINNFNIKINNINNMLLYETINEKTINLVHFNCIFIIFLILMFSFFIKVKPNYYLL